MLQQLIRALFDPGIPGCHPRLLPQSRQYLAGGPGSAATSRRAQTKTAATLTKPPRRRLLDHAAEHMAAMVGCSDHCETGDGGRVASGGLPPVLALAIAVAQRPTQGERGDSDSHPPHGGRECRLGSTEDPRRTSEAGTLAQQFGGADSAASNLGFSSVQALHDGFTLFCARTSLFRPGGWRETNTTTGSSFLLLELLCPRMCPRKPPKSCGTGQHPRSLQIPWLLDYPAQARFAHRG
jgi:hypothetical protein